MARGDPVWMRFDVNWPDDPRAKGLTAAENWLYTLVRCKAVEERTNVLPRVYRGSYFVSKGSLKRKSWDNLIRKALDTDPDRPIIFLNAEGCICMPNLGMQHEKLDWNGDRGGPQHSPHGADKGPMPSSRARKQTLQTLQTLQTELTDPPLPPDGGSTSRCEIDDFRERWNKLPEPIPKILRMGKARLRSLKARLAEKWWKENHLKALDAIPSRPFLMGDKGWVANVDWFLRPESVAKILEGQYVEPARYNGEPEPWMSAESTDENPVKLEDIPEVPRD